MSKLRSHRKTHDGYSCNYENCIFIAFKWSDLRKHTALEHKRSYSCNLCKKVLTSQSALNSHKLNHQEYQKDRLICPVKGCKRSYAKKSNLKSHIKISHGEPNFKCTFEDCLKKFYHKKSLKIHLESEHNPDGPKRVIIWITFTTSYTMYNEG